MEEQAIELLAASQEATETAAELDKELLELRDKICKNKYSLTEEKNALEGQLRGEMDRRWLVKSVENCQQDFNKLKPYLGLLYAALVGPDKAREEGPLTKKEEVLRMLGKAEKSLTGLLED